MQPPFVRDALVGSSRLRQPHADGRISVRTAPRQDPVAAFEARAALSRAGSCGSSAGGQGPDQEQESVLRTGRPGRRQRILFPDGSSLRLDNMPASDAGGYAGLTDRVDGHSWQLIKGVILSSLLGAGSQLSLGNDHGIVRALRESVQQNASQAGGQIVSRGLDIQPTIRVRPGWPVRVLVSEDLVLQPWKG